MFPELRSRLEGLNSKEKTAKKAPKYNYFRVENTIFKVPENVTLLGIQKTQQLVKAIRDKAPSIEYQKALTLSAKSIEEQESIPINYQQEIITAITAIIELSDKTIDSIMESSEEIRVATIEDLVNF